MLDAVINNSSAIKRIQHQGETLRVTFKTGKSFDYEDVSAELAKNLIKADKPDSFMIYRIIPDRDYTVVDESDMSSPLAWD